MINNIKNFFTNYNPYINGHERMHKSSILIPLVEKNSKTHILFQVRSKNLKIGPSEISFPGGMFEEKDVNPKQTAIRETCEELGLKNADIDIISPLNIFITPFNMIIHPYLGIIKNLENININKSEVDHIFLAPIDFFINNKPNLYITGVDINPPDNFPYDLIPNGKNYKFKKGVYDIFLYKYNQYIIWGITAKILKDFIDNLKERF